MPRRSFPVWVILISASCFLSLSARADDWPQWRGPQRDGNCRETGLLKTWPQGGPALVWKVEGLGEGYAGVAVVKGRIYTMGNRGGTESVIAISADKGKEIWSYEIGKADSDGSGHPGPRSTPTIDGGALYTLGIDGELVCIDTASGELHWRKDLRKEFAGETPGWGYSESVLIDGNAVLCTPGGNEATIVALNKKDGALVWKASIPRDGSQGGKTDRAQYSSIVKAKLGGVDQYIQFLRSGVAAVSAADGEFLWRYNRSANGTANITTPIFHGNFVFTASGYSTGGGLVEVARNGEELQAKEVYFTNKMKNHHGGVVLVGGHIYGFDEGILRCLDFKTGKGVWENRSVGKGSVLYADGHIIARSENGPVALVEATSSGYVEKGRFEPPNRSGKNTWPHPVISDGKLYLRDQGVLLSYDVKG